MKHAIRRVALVSMIAMAPALSFAQTAGNAQGPLTRAQVRQELVDLESVGYSPTTAADATYPQQVQEAMQRLAQKRADEARVAQQQAAQSGYGEPGASRSDAGAPAAARAAVSVGPGSGVPQAYLHH